ncbi:MAG: CpaF family protein [Clostridiaceae bacterium]
MAYSSFNFGAPNHEEAPAYEVSEVKSQEVEDLSLTIQNKIIDLIQVMPERDDLDAKVLVNKMVQEELRNELQRVKKHLSASDKMAVQNSVMDEIFGFGPITKLLDDPTVTEIMVNGPFSVFVEKNGKLHKAPTKFRNDRHVYHTIDKIIAPLGRRVDESSPMVDARLPDGSRVNVIIPPLAVTGPTITIRKFAANPYTLDNLITFGTLNLEMASFFKSCVRGRLNIIVSGGTGSGKTTLLNVLSGFIPHDERIVTIEDAAELQLQQEHVISLESRPSNIEGKGRITIRDLVVNSLRMRPDRIIVGEVRSAETLDMLQAMNTGHDGSITTVHANTPRDSLARLETMIHMGGIELPSRAIREQIASSINIIIQISRYPDGSRKISKVTEITGMEGDTITLQDLFLFNQEGYDINSNVTGRHVSTGVVPTFMDRLKTYGENIHPNIFKPATNKEGF